jgi:hypothetical protein
VDEGTTKLEIGLTHDAQNTRNQDLQQVLLECLIRVDPLATVEAPGAARGPASE